MQQQICDPGHSRTYQRTPHTVMNKGAYKNHGNHTQEKSAYKNYTHQTPGKRCLQDPRVEQSEFLVKRTNKSYGSTKVTVWEVRKYRPWSAHPNTSYTLRSQKKWIYRKLRNLYSWGGLPLFRGSVTPTSPRRSPGL